MELKIRRTLAFTIDTLLVLTWLITGFGGIAVFLAVLEYLLLLGEVTLLVLYLFLSLIFLLPAMAFHAFRDGFGSPGKRLLGLRVVDVESGQPCTMRQSMIRNRMSSLLGKFDLIMVLVRKDGGRAGDEMAGTRVVMKGRHSLKRKQSP